MQYIKNAYSNWYKFEGRSSRVEYWGTFAFNILLAFSSLYFFGEGLYSIIALISLPVGIGLGIRRMHDAGVSGWFLIVPVANILYALSNSEQKKNKWGPVPNESLKDVADVNTDTVEFEVAESENFYDEELDELEKRLVELQELKKAQDAAELEKNSRKEEILKQIEDLKKELDE